MSKKITLIYPFAYGYLDFVVQELQKNDDVIVTDIKTNTIKYQYPNLGAKIWNGITKTFGKNIKKDFFRQQILDKVLDNQDIIFVIRPDLLDISLLKNLKKKTKNFIAYYYDSCKKYPKQLEIVPFFDEIYSYEQEDIKNNHFLETSNFIYDEKIESSPIKYDIFNISSYDSRINEIVSLSRKLVEEKFKINFLLYWPEKLNYPHLTSITHYLSLEETKKIIAESKAMIDIQRKDQKGLSFRTFEALGYKKKLITTNDMVKNYDFYHPNNILIIDSENVYAEKIREFLALPYEEVSEKIIDQYRVKTFTKRIFKL